MHCVCDLRWFLELLAMCDGACQSGKCLGMRRNVVGNFDS